LFQRIEQRLAALPGVESVSAETTPLLANSQSNDDFIPTGTVVKKGENTVEFENEVGADYFTTLRIPMVAGRSFTAADTATSQHVAVVNEALAKKYWGNASPIGRTFTTSDMDDTKLLYTIVGVCANTHYAQLREDPPPLFFLNYQQAPEIDWGITFVVRTRSARTAIAPSLRTAVESVDHDLPMIDVRTQVEQIAEITTEERVLADLTGGFGVLALVLACIGIYGIMAYTVSRRTNEIGIRMALGAQRGRVLRMVLGEAWWMAALGVVAGLGGAVALGRLVGSMLYGLKAWDPMTLSGAAALLLLVALGASWLPARRAAGVDPMRALRHE
jgi:predicted permease